jgi:hypothetical protein
MTTLGLVLLVLGAGLGTWAIWPAVRRWRVRRYIQQERKLMTRCDAVRAIVQRK